MLDVAHPQVSSHGGTMQKSQEVAKEVGFLGLEHNSNTETKALNPKA